MSDPLVITYVPGYQFPLDGSVQLTYELLNKLAQPSINLAGSIGTVVVADASITLAKLANNALAASATGLGKMQDGYFSADATGRAKFVAGFFAGGDATSLAFFEDGFFDSNAACRAKFAPGFITGREIAPSVAPLQASVRNLLLQTSGVATLTIAADEIIAKDTSGKPWLTDSASATVNLAASGANGLDTGSEGVSTWYYVWWIVKSDGTSPAGLLSTSATAPTLPAGYTFKALLGQVRNNSAGDLVTSLQQGRDVFLNDTNLFTAKGAAVTDTYESYSAGGGADVDLRTVIPPNAKRLRGTIGGVTANGHGVAVAADANGLGAVTFVANNVGSTANSFNLAGGFDIPLKTAQTIYWKAVSTSARSRLNVSGYSF